SRLEWRAGALGSGDVVGARAAEDVADGLLGDVRLAVAQRVVLAQGMADELLVHEDAPQVRVTREADPVEVPDEALPPVRALEDVGDARERGVVFTHADLQAHHL